jgi:hypothetical protein
MQLELQLSEAYQAILQKCLKTNEAIMKDPISVLYVYMLWK